MALLIALAVIGGIACLVALYVLGTYLIAAILGHTILFKDKVNAIINDYRAKRLAKKQAKADKVQVEEVEVKEE